MSYVSLSIAAVAQSMTVDDTNQTAPVQIMDVFVLCYFTQTEPCNFDSCIFLIVCTIL